jgi:uncharacterized membrane protein
MKDPIQESHTRTIIKTFSWRAMATVITMVVAFAFTGNTETALEIGLADTLIKLFAYYGHERIWVRLRVGQKKSPEYEI